MITWKTSGQNSTLAMLVLMLSGVHWVWGYQESAIPIAAVQRDKPVDFTSDVLPILQRNCLACHNQQDNQGGLVLETPESMRKGGDNGPALLPTRGDDSLMLKYAAHQIEPVMPPKGNDVNASNLTSEELGLLRLWINQGALGTITTVNLSPKSMRPIPSRLSPIYSLDLTEDGQYLAVARSNRLYLVHAPTGKVIANLSDSTLAENSSNPESPIAHRDLIQSLAFNLEGDLLASGGFREVKLWRRPSDVKLLDIATGAPVTAVATSPDGKSLVVGNNAGVIQFYDANSGQPGIKINGHTGKVVAIRFTADGRLLTASQDQTIRCWNPSDGSPIGVIETPSPIHAIELTALPKKAENEASSPTTAIQQLVSAGVDQMVRVWNLPASSPKSIHSPFQGGVRSAFSKDQSMVAIALGDGSVQVNRRDEVGNYRTIAQWRVASEALLSLAFVEAKNPKAEEGKSAWNWLATLAVDGTVTIHDIDKQAPVSSWRTGPVNATSFAASSDGKSIATGGADGLIRLWSGDALLQPAVEANTVSTPLVYAISQQRSLMAVIGVSDGAPAIKVVETETGKVSHHFTGYNATLRALAFSADGSRLIAGAGDKSLLLWNLSEPPAQMPKKVEGLSAAVTAICFSPDASQALVGTADNMVYLVNLADGMVVQKFAGHSATILGVGYAAQLPYSISRDRSVRFWNPADGSQTRTFNDQAATVAWAISPDGNSLALAADDKNIRLYQTASGQLLQTLSGHTQAASSLAFSADGKKLVSTTTLADRPSESVVWDLGGAAPRVQEVLLEKDVKWSVFDTKSERLWTQTNAGLSRRIPLRFVRYLEGQTQPVRAMVFTGNGQTLLTAGQDGGVRGYQTANGQATFTTSHGAPVTAIGLSADDTLFVTGGENSTLRLWQANGNALGVQQIQGVKGIPQSVAVSGDNQSVIVGCKGDKPTVQVYDMASGKMVQQFSDSVSGVIGLAVALTKPAVAASKDARSNVITVSADAIYSSELLSQRVIAGHSGEVTALAAMPDQPRQLWSGSLDSTIRLWNLDNGQAIRQINHGGPLLAIAVRPDGQRLASVSENKTAKLWQINGQQVAELRGDLRVRTQLARATYQQTSATAMVNVSKQRFEAAEKDLPLKQEAEKKVAETLAAAEKALVDKQAVLEKAGTEKMAAEKEAIDAAAAARAALVLKTTAEKAFKTATTDAEVAQQRSNQIAALANASPSDAALKTAAEQAAMKLTAAQQVVQQSQAAMQQPSEAYNAATTTANTAAQKVTTLQKPYNDAKVEVMKATADRNLALQQHEIAARELKSAQEKVPTLQAVFAEAERNLAGAKMRLEAAQKALADSEMPIRSVAFSSDGSVLITGGDLPNVHAWDGEAGTPAAVYAGHAAALSSVAMLDNERLVSASADGSVKVWQRNAPWRLERTIGSLEQPDLISHRVLSLDFNPDSSQLLVAGGVPSRDGQLQTFLVADGSRVTQFANLHSDVIHSARFSPDGKRIATASADKYVRTIDVASGQMLHRFEGHTNYVLSVSWKGDGQTLVSGGADNAIKVWEVETADQKRTIDNNLNKAITKIEYIGETDTIVSSSGDRGVRIHNAENGGVVRNFAGAKSWLHSVDVSADGSVVVTGGEDGKVLIWNGVNGQLLHTIELGARS